VRGQIPKGLMGVERQNHMDGLGHVYILPRRRRAAIPASR
jgi:hypothetical protein